VALSELPSPKSRLASGPGSRTELSGPTISNRGREMIGDVGSQITRDIASTSTRDVVRTLGHDGAGGSKSTSAVSVQS